MAKSTSTIYERAGFDNEIGYGETPAVVVVDLQQGFTDPDHPLGGDLTGVVERTNEVLQVAHARDVPIVFTRIVVRHPDGADLGIWREKAPKLTQLREETKWVALDDRLSRSNTDYLLDKRQASAFHQTELDSVLTARNIDTVVVTGCTTSGCVRATVVDACSHGYRPVIPEECVGDRAADPHDANLFDMNAKYGDVRATADVIGYLDEQ